MHFADEIVDMKNLEILPGDNPKPDKRELLIALQLIESLSTEFTPAKYRDEYREKVMAMIEKKAKGQDIVAQPSSAEQPGTKVVDLMAALEASLATLNKKQSAQTPVKARRRKARAQ